MKHLWLIKAWFSASTFVVKIATLAKLPNVSSNYMIRFDITSTLIHLTREIDKSSAEDIFDKIVNEGKIIGSRKAIRGGYKCVCFSETPISAIGQIIAQEDKEFRYGPFGFIFTKEYLFNLGARPVIYQPESDYNLLPDELKYRHVRYEPTSPDWTWEREWRLKTDELTLDPKNVTLIVKDREKVDKIKKQKLSGIDPLSIATDGYRSSKKLIWHFISLEDLGLK
jgi:hypothetical protein